MNQNEVLHLYAGFLEDLLSDLSIGEKLETLTKLHKHETGLPLGAKSLIKARLREVEEEIAWREYEADRLSQLGI